MTDTQPHDQRPPDRRRRSSLSRMVLASGESLVAHLGLALGTVLLGVLAASSWWTLHTHRASVQAARTEQVRMASRLLSRSIESMLASGDVSAVRRSVADAAMAYDLKTCRVVLPGGGVVADSSGGKVDVLRMPEEWPTGTLPAEQDNLAGDGASLALSAVLDVPERGQAWLEVAGDVTAPAWATWEVQTGIGVIGVLGMGSLLVVYHGMRRRLRGLGAIRDALAAMASGTSETGALLVSGGFGPEAKAWNSLMEERETLRTRRTLGAAAERLGGRDASGGDLTSACDALSQGLIVVDATGKARYANGAAGVLLGVKREQLIGQDLAGLLNAPAAVDALKAATSGASRARASFEVERPGATPGDRTVLRVSVRPMRRGDGVAAIVVVEDLTQQRVADESRNAFVAQATHELRTPLTNIRLYVDTLVDDGEKDPALKAKCLNVISQEARRLERIVGDMLSVGEIEAGSLKLRTGDVRLDAVFAELKDDFAAQAQSKDIKFTIDLPPKLPVMQGDRDKVVLALHNLVGNAIKYTPAGGAVTVKVAADPGTLTVEVADTGIGIKQDELELVFEKFYRAKDPRINGITGSGLGLALARQIVRLHGGDLMAASQIDKGSTFTATFPLGSVVGQGGEARQAA